MSSRRLRVNMITKLDNSKNKTAEQIYNVFQRSYQVEAELIGVDVFPPLKRTIQDIKDSPTNFLGFISDQELAGVIELNKSERRLEIDSLTVDPDFFRKGIARKLLAHTLQRCVCPEILVETATANKPAIELYEGCGFVETNRWTPEHGIEKVAFRYQSESQLGY